MLQTDDQAKRFLAHLDGWLAALPEAAIAAIAPDPARAAIISVDVINGFCDAGALFSPRVKAIVAPVTHLMTLAWAHGIRQFLLVQEDHPADATEFEAYPPHCVRGTREAETVDAIRALPFFDRMTIIHKNSIHPALGTDFDAWIAARPEVDTFIVVGDCTDLCTYQLAMHLRLAANASQTARQVIVPAATCDTYETPVSVAEELGIPAHPGDLMHGLFLYHMMSNGITIVKAITA